jgi:alpha-tubulin suppressor-like RCC1 family protein
VSGSWCNTTPLPVAGLPAVVQIEAGDGWACALSSAGEVWCWGRNDFGNLGQGTVGVPATSSTPLEVEGLSGVSAISVGDGSHACALRTDGTALCWGGNASGALGHQPGTSGDDASKRNATPTPMFGPDNATPLAGLTAISAHGPGTCALRGGAPLCNARDDFFGADAGVATFVLQPVPGFPTDASSLDAAHQLCVVQGSGALWCGGSDYNGELGNGTYMSSYEPPYAPAVPQVTYVRTDGYGQNYTFVVTVDGTVWASGSDYYGELGHVPGTEGGQQTYCTGCWSRSSFAIVPNLP